jgi:hypothetical protein
LFSHGIDRWKLSCFLSSKFKPITVLKEAEPSGEVWAKGLVIFQFTLSIISSFRLGGEYRSNSFKPKTLVIKDNVLTYSEGIINERKKLLFQKSKDTGVMAAPGGHDMTGHNGGTYGIEWPGKNPEDRTEFENMPANYGLIEMLGIEIKEGRPFSRDFADSSSIIFNEAAIKFMGLTDPLGKEVKLWGRNMQIVGVRMISILNLP